MSNLNENMDNIEEYISNLAWLPTASDILGNVYILGDGPRYINLHDALIALRKAFRITSHKQGQRGLVYQIIKAKVKTDV
jgi:hypothetical protein